MMSVQIVNIQYARFLDHKVHNVLDDVQNIIPNKTFLQNMLRT